MQTKFLKNFFKKLRWILFGTALLAITVSVALVAALRWINPPVSSFMLIRQLEAWGTGEKQFQIHYEWRYWNQIAPELFLAVIASEDQKYPHHRGFDIESIHQALLAWHRTGRLRGASTISQQVAKNLFLWNGRSFLRKALEAYFTLLLETLLEKKRILEIYANIAEFGNGIYGAESASSRYFGKHARQINEIQASRLAAVLPSPRKLHADRPSAYVERKSRWIRKQMSQLGGILYLQEI
ncbi:MAG: monofunctional biosynthetic peptidoglycan transglycosylase [Gammaproteobacteria bacterium]